MMENTAERAQRKTRIGIVASNKMEKTVSVTIDRVMKHPKYGRVVRRSMKVLAHDENGQAGIGDRVLIMETRPLSKRKCWRLVEVLEKAR
jgi:small subunit ribosomal protein S17